MRIGNYSIGTVTQSRVRFNVAPWWKLPRVRITRFYLPGGFTLWFYTRRRIHSMIVFIDKVS